MRGENITRIGLVSLLLGIILLIVWVSLYDGENNIVIDGKVTPQNNASKALLTTGSVFTAVGYTFSFFGTTIMLDMIDFSIKMPKNNLIET